MKYYLTPIEDPTNYTYRNVYHIRYHAMDKYSIPFLSPKASSKLNFRKLNDILPERNQDMYAVPQILTNQAGDLIQIAKELREYGYSEISLSLGCPSGAVVSGHKGVGFLRRPDSLDRFLNGVCGKMDEMGMEVSVKIRLGLISPDKFMGPLETYNRYPLKELIPHPGVRADCYKNIPNMPAFHGGLNGSRLSVCYNGDISTISDYETLCEDHPELDRVVLDHGIIFNPGLLDRVAAGRNSGGPGTDKETLKRFHQMIYESYR